MTPEEKTKLARKVAHNVIDFFCGLIGGSFLLVVGGTMLLSIPEWLYAGAFCLFAIVVSVMRVIFYFTLEREIR